MKFFLGSIPDFFGPFLASISRLHFSSAHPTNILQHLRSKATNEVSTHLKELESLVGLPQDLAILHFHAVID
jgi:hypothetical protein